MSERGKVKGRVKLRTSSRPLRAYRVPVREIVQGLLDLYPGARCELVYRNPYELLVATVLSAQTTDAKVNAVTPELFRRYPDARALSEASPEDLYPILRTLGLYRIKAERLVALARELVERHGGEVPADVEALTALPGVGRKTANVVVANAFAIPAFAVDTHIRRVARRLGLTTSSKPETVEREITRIVPKRFWITLHHALIWHGRRMCHARSPKCHICPLRSVCRAWRSGEVRPARGTADPGTP
ncbi:endonuclease III [Brockia lithotrophica]|uniref:Endonuclease III n=1 Tax=Brockia lithotrophica TaxID=933949 RepID=A0A660KVQ0_9BACL|nr:endonuclease III [Brockia lithotrophica]RKQ85421.1 DNA-(apurinic or apyrimidinic site) lyase /endonuclease III [Brockia lithotrophica]